MHLLNTRWSEVSCFIHFLGLCSWAINIVRFFKVYCDVEPKRKALEAANAELAAAQEKLSKIKAKIKVRMVVECCALRIRTYVLPFCIWSHVTPY